MCVTCLILIFEKNRYIVQRLALSQPSGLMPESVTLPSNLPISQRIQQRTAGLRNTRHNENSHKISDFTKGKYSFT